MRAKQRSSTTAIATVMGTLAAIAACVWWAGRDVGVALAANPEVRVLDGVDEPVLATAALLPAEVATTAEGVLQPAAASGRTSADDAEAAVDAAVVARLVDDMHDDDVRGNGLEAFWALCKLPRGRLAAVEAALGSGDMQQRTYAGGVLRQRCRELGSAPSAALLAETVAATRRDVRVDVNGTSMWPLAATSLRFLVDHVESAREPLLRALTAGDDQQRLYAAYLLANVADERLAPRIVSELALHLEHNEIEGDALLAGHGLYRLGALGLPAVREWRRALDAQGRALLELVELDVRSPPRDPEALRERKSRHQITSLYHDPVVEYDLWRSAVPRW